MENCQCPLLVTEKALKTKKECVKGFEVEVISCILHVKR